MKHVYMARRFDDGKWYYSSKLVSKEDVLAIAYGGCVGCKGHDTKEEALEHQREFEILKCLDRIKFGDFHKLDTLHGCEVKNCDGATVKAVLCGPGLGVYLILCEAHQNRTGVNEAFFLEDKYVFDDTHRT